MDASSVKDGLSAIACEILEDVCKEAEALIAASEEEAKRALQAAKEESEKNYQAIIDSATNRAEMEKRKIKSLTEVEARNQLLQTKEAVIDAAFETALSQINAFTKTEQYHNYLLTLIEKTARKIGSKKLIIHVNAEDRKWLNEESLTKLSKKFHLELQLSNRDELVAGGCRIETVDGKIVLNNTMENRLQELKPALRVEVARILFDKEA